MTYYYESELYHHGIKGQKWGVRRYQNEDGTLTAAGKERYSGNDTSSYEQEGRFENFGRGVKDAGKAFGRGVKNVGKTVGRGVKDVSKDSILIIKDLGRTFGRGVKNATEDSISVFKDSGRTFAHKVIDLGTSFKKEKNISAGKEFVEKRRK